MDPGITGLKAAADVCTLCGSCVNECPLFREDLTEPSSPRGMISLIREVINGDMDDSMELYDRISSCLLCGNCVSACSKGIDILAVITGYRAFSGFHTGIGSVAKYQKMIGKNPDRLSGDLNKSERFDILLFPGYLMLMNYPELVRRTIEVLNQAGLKVLLLPDLDPLGSYYFYNGYTGEFRKTVSKNISVMKEYMFGGILSLNGRDALILRNEYGERAGRIFELMEFSSKFLGGIRTGIGADIDPETSVIHTSLFDRNYLKGGEFEQIFLESVGKGLTGLPPLCCGSGRPEIKKVPGRIIRLTGARFYTELKSRGIESVITSSPECYDTIRRFLPSGARYLIEIFIP